MKALLITLQFDQLMTDGTTDHPFPELMEWDEDLPVLDEIFPPDNPENVDFKNISLIN